MRYSRSQVYTREVLRLYFCPVLPSYAIQMLKDIDKFNGELVMDVELLDAFDDEADQGYYEDEALTVDQLQTILDVTSPFAGGNTFEKLPGQVAPVAKSSGPTP